MILGSWTFNQLCLLALGAYAIFLTRSFRVRNKHVLIQQRRYPMFAVRDHLVQMRLDGKISEELFRESYNFCNAAMSVSDKLDLIHMAETMAKAARPQSQFVKLASAQVQRDPEFLKLYIEMISHVIKWAIYNSITNRPHVIIQLYAKGRAASVINDFKQLWHTRRQLKHAAA